MKPPWASRKDIERLEKKIDGFLVSEEETVRRYTQVAKNQAGLGDRVSKFERKKGAVEGHVGNLEYRMKDLERRMENLERRIRMLEGRNVPSEACREAGV